MKKPHYLLALALLTTSCTTAGPFVTSISSDGRGNLIIEKSMVKFDSFMGTVSNENSTTTSIRLFDMDDLKRSDAPVKPKEIWTGGEN